MAILHAFNKPAREPEYPLSFARNVHLRLTSFAGETELNHGYAVLYAKAAVREDDTLAERFAADPVLFEDEEGYGVLARETDREGKGETRLLWRTRDFVHFDEAVRLPEGSDLPQGSGSLEIPDDAVRPILDRWTPAECVGVVFEEESDPDGTVVYPDREALRRTEVTVRYSDGTGERRRIRWDEDALGTPRPGETMDMTGTVEAVSPVFPLAVGYADPVIFPWNNRWYMLATNDNVNDIGLFIRRADTVAGLFTDTMEERMILAPDGDRFVQTFWAPEFHVIGGRAYILFAVSNQSWGPRCHIMRLKEGADPLFPESWEEPIRVRRKDGSFLTEDGITLDMTFFRGDEKAYVVWSYRRHIGTPKDTGSMLYIAEADEERPWVLASEPVLLSRPLYGWENVNGTINNEGPYALVHEGKVYLGYSGGDACGYFYTVGYLVADTGDDLTKPESWTKLPSPMLASTFVPGIQGPGHHSFFRDGEGRWMIAYHAQERDQYNCRCATYHKVHFDKTGMPRLDVTGDRDVKPELRTIKAPVQIKG